MRIETAAGASLMGFFGLILYLGMGIVTHLIVMPTPPDLNSFVSWVIMLSWPVVLLFVCFVAAFISAVVLAVIKVLFA